MSVCRYIYIYIYVYIYIYIYTLCDGESYDGDRVYYRHLVIHRTPDRQSYFMCYCSKGGSETFKNFVFLVSPKVFLVFFGSFGVLEGFLGVVKTCGKTKTTTKKH